MSRLALLAIYMVWMGWSANQSGPGVGADSSRASLVLFFGVHAALVLGLRAWALMASRRSPRSLHRFHQANHIGRLLIPVWLAAGVFVLGWGPAVESLMRPLYRWPSPQMHVELPQLFIGTLPAVAAWMLLWWSQFPVERALREQRVLANLDDDLPIYAPPKFWNHVSANFRLQVMFTLAPVLLIVLIRDVTTVALSASGVRNAQGVENYVVLPATFAVLLLAPEILRRVLHTERLPDSPLRRRLDAICHDANLKYRDILLWRTEGTMANAAVMGLFGRVRYVLLSDLLLESMTDEQIEAVFAHELGHVAHKHLAWFALYAALALCFVDRPMDVLLLHLKHWYEARHFAHGWEYFEGLITACIGFGALLLAFGFLSPRFERQADVFAARLMQKQATSPPSADADTTAIASRPASFVGEYGAGIFASALHRVAVINHIPVAARNWSHGSIAQRMRALHEMSAHPSLTERFDRYMVRVYTGLLACMCLFGVLWYLSPTSDEGAAGAARPPAVMTNAGVHATR